jgi:hypothetical protein
MCRNAGFSLNAVHETDNVVASLTLVSAELGVCFCTPTIRQLWPHLEVRPLLNSMPIEQAVAYRQDARNTALEVFLDVVRRVASGPDAGVLKRREYPLLIRMREPKREQQIIGYSKKDYRFTGRVWCKVPRNQGTKILD